MNIEKDIKEGETNIAAIVDAYNAHTAKMQELETEFNKLRGERDELGIKFREQNAVLDKLKSYLTTEEKPSEENTVEKVTK